MSSPDPAQLREFATRYTAAWCSQDPAAVAAFFSPTGSLKVNDAAPAVGRAAITDVAHGFMTAFPDLQVLMDDISVQRDRALYLLDPRGHKHGARRDRPQGPDQRGRGVAVWR